MAGMPLTPRGQVGQPQVAAGINPASPQARGLTAAIGSLPFINVDATGNNKVVSIGTPGQTTTSRGKALLFDSASGLYLPSNSNLDLPPTFAMSAWIYISSTPTFHTIVSKGTSGVTYDAYTFGIGVTTNGQQRFGGLFRTANGSASYQVDQAPGYITTTGWYHAVVTHDGSTLYLYINGVLNNTGTGSATGPYANTSPAFIGGVFNSTPAAAGSSPVVYPIQDVRIYRRHLSVQDVGEQYTAGWRLFAPSPRRIYTSSAATQTTINATPGAYAWAAVTSAIPGQVNAAIGAYAWTGITAGITQVVSSGTGAYAWSGTTAATSALINASAGAYAWSGITAALSNGIAASPGTFSWTGSTASIPSVVGATPGVYSWSGSSATIPGQISATPAAWTFAGVTATLAGAIAATPGAYSWIATTASIPAQITAGTGAYAWAATTASIPAQISAGSGAYAWTGTTAAIPVLLTAVRGAYTWTGTTANLGGTLSKNGSYYLEVDEGLAVMVGMPMLPNWNTSGRPLTPKSYMYGFNSDTSKLEMWNGSAWVGTLLS